VSQVLVRGSVSPATGAVTGTITGAFVLPYTVGLEPGGGWITDWGITGKTATQFTWTSNVPAVAGATLGYTVTIDTPAAVGTGTATTAAGIINSVRDQIPDPIFNASGIRIDSPDADGGLFSAVTLYRWLDTGVRRLAQACGAIIEDWTAIGQVASQPWYAVDPKFIEVLSGFSNQWPIETFTLAEEDVIWPSTSVATSQSLWGYYRKRTDHLEFGLWPLPNVVEPSTTLVNTIAASAADPIALVSTATFLSFGYVQIDAEIIQYQKVTTSPVGIGVISRGQAGTTAAAHAAGATVSHLGLWLKGRRTPGTISSSTSVVEIPQDILMHLETYVLARCRRAENEHEEARALMKDFDAVCASLRADPTRKESQWQAPAFGTPRVGPIYWGSLAGGRIIR
jgi:hypothetical protein